ncbi:MAG TPA: hypothetical protein VM370_09910 [Candidatus Thermoplasmatota archaeon]|nr:hypothetical protein [Candidatus Thermoplasmatota archaeon]
MDWHPLAGPFRAFRDRYVAHYGGLSYDLAPRAVGVHPGHLSRVPELAGREVLVSHDGLRPAPLVKRPAFRVVELNGLMRDALGLAEHGIVFSVFDLEDPDTGKVLAALAPGDGVYLNSALDRMPGDVVRRPDVAS